MHWTDRLAIASSVASAKRYLGLKKSCSIVKQIVSLQNEDSKASQGCNVQGLL